MILTTTYKCIAASWSYLRYVSLKIAWSLFISSK
jgi:hypothetical protein